MLLLGNTQKKQVEMVPDLPHPPLSNTQSDLSGHPRLMVYFGHMRLSIRFPV